MTPVERSSVEIEAALRRHFGQVDPGSAPLALSAAVDRIPSAVDRLQPISLLSRLTPALSLTAAVAVLALLVKLVTIAGPGIGSGATPTPVAFDPTLAGPGVGPAFDTGTPWLLVVLVVAILAGVAMGLDRRGRVVVGAAAAGLLGYALFGTFVPVDLGYTGWGAGLNVVAAEMPAGASEQLYYEVAPPRQPFSFALMLMGGTTPPVRIEGLVDESAAEGPGLLWRSVWLDGDEHGGLSGPARPFEPFTITEYPQGIWLVGQAGACASGHPPDRASPRSGAFSTIESVRLNVTVYGWPRVIDVAVPHLVEEAGTCPPTNASPAP
jgi:hypothetical protein